MRACRSPLSKDLCPLMAIFLEDVEIPIIRKDDHCWSQGRCARTLCHSTIMTYYCCWATKMKRLASLIVVASCLFGGRLSALGAPLGYTPPKYMERAGAPTPEWAKAHPRLTTEQTPQVSHDCSKNLHSERCVKRCAKNLATEDTTGVNHVCKKTVHNPRCIKKCVIATTETKPTGPPPIWHSRTGSAFPVRHHEAENTLLDRLYNQHVEGTVLKPNNN